MKFRIVDVKTSRRFRGLLSGQRMGRSSVATFSVLLVPEPSGVPVIDRIVADDLPAVGDLIRVRGNLAQVTHVWPGEQAAEVRAIGRPSLEG